MNYMLNLPSGHVEWGCACTVTRSGGQCHARICDEIGDCLQSLDLSPLAKFMERRGLRGSPPGDYAHKRGVWHMSRPGPAMRQLWGNRSYEQALALWRAAEPYADFARMYGIDFGVDTAAPEPTPADRALDKITEAEREFIEKRRAKRETAGRADEAKKFRDSYADHKAEHDRAEALDRALSKSFIHHTNFTERLSPYRGWST